MSKQEDILAGDFGLTDEVAPVAKSADAETLVTRLEDRFSDSMTLLKRIMQGALGHVDQFQQVAEQQQTAIDMGKSDDLAGAMIASQQASLSFSALVQVRNKIATGFNDLMSMSI